ncbi:MAG: N-acetyl-gamma-glutamyl-phosphate reductase [Spirochaetes bacterium]|nr:N-acetyl-gamma-glutamyl-phosphate reductase [Spirochaetota bacterium]
MKNVTIIGATGFGGLGLIEILLRHPGFKIKQLVARKDVGMKINEVFPHLTGFCEAVVEDPENIDYSGIDLAFFSTPDRAGMTLIKQFLDKDIPVIDFSGDFRFNDAEVYSGYARFKNMKDEHLCPDVLQHAVYGLPELNAEKIKTAKIVGNPGCFAISLILGLLPAVEKGIIKTDGIICDGKTGVSGAGKNPGEANFYPQRYENINTYREGKHQHIFEVENLLNSRSKTPVNILFIPQIIPMTRGILSTIYASLTANTDTKEVLEIYREYYKDKPFVAVTDKSPGTADVKGSNRCIVRPMIDEKTGLFFATSVIDNLLKGQSGNAVQNANIIFGFDEKTGLDVPAFYP